MTAVEQDCKGIYLEWMGCVHGEGSFCHEVLERGLHVLVASLAQRNGAASKPDGTLLEYFSSFIFNMKLILSFFSLCL